MAEQLETAPKIDKSAWGSGEWTDEPDSLNFKTDEGFDAVIIRQSSGGHLCGYVGIPASHPWHGKSYSAGITPTAEQLDRPVDMDKISVISLFASAIGGEASPESVRIDCLVSVHGGLTYSDRGVAKFGEDPALWYFGFDCAHSGDHSPGYDHRYSSGGSYRDIAYVKGEIAALSKQLASVA